MNLNEMLLTSTWLANKLREAEDQLTRRVAIEDELRKKLAAVESIIAQMSNAQTINPEARAAEAAAWQAGAAPEQSPPA